MSDDQPGTPWAEDPQSPQDPQSQAWSSQPHGAPPWQPLSEPDSILPGHRAPAARRSLTSRSIAGLSAVALVLLAGGGYLLSRTQQKSAAAPSRQPAAPSVPASATASPSSKPTPRISSNATVSATGWVDSTVHPVTAPVFIDGVIVVYTADKGELTLRGVDPASGGTVWSKPASAAQATPGQSFEVTYVGTTVLYYASSGDPKLRFANVVAVDAATGKRKWISAHAIPFADMPHLCTDNLALCVSAYTDADQAVGVRVDVKTGVEQVMQSNSGRTLGTGVWDAGSRDPEYIEHIDDATGRVVWKDPVLKLVGSPVSSDRGWNWDSYGDVYVGWLGAVPATAAPKVLDLGGQQTIAVRATDGVRLWKTPGLYGCPVQGLTDQGQPIAVRCVVKGTATFGVAGSDPTVKGLDVTLQGFDVHTGATTWSVHLGNAPSAVGLSSHDTVRMSADVFAVSDAAGRVRLINFKTGAESAAAPGVDGWCLQESSWSWNENPTRDGSPVEYATGELVAACTPAGAPGQPSDGTSTGAGATASGYFIWSSTDGLHALKLAKS